MNNDFKKENDQTIDYELQRWLEWKLMNVANVVETIIIRKTTQQDCWNDHKLVELVGMFMDKEDTSLE